MALCKFCNKWITQPEGRKKKEFCNSTCRSNFWYKNKETSVKIYGLLNPLTELYFYIGVTSHTLEKRLTNHMSSTDKNKEKVEVIRNILDEGKRPKICLIETLPSERIDESSERELFWIKWYINEGHPLVNKAMNGVGSKPSSNPKKQVSLYVEKNKFYKFGGEEKMKDKLYEFIDNFGEPNNRTKEFDSPIIKNDFTDEPKQWQESKIKIKRSFENYMQLRKDCIDEDEWLKLKEEILNVDHLSQKQKSLLTN